MRLIRDAHRIDEESRPLIIAGGPHAVYQPYDLFAVDPDFPGGADVVVTGEEFVLLSLLEAILTFRRPGESMRSAFARTRDAGALDGIPGLVYPRGDRGNGVPAELIDTGIQRLLGDLDELSHPALGFSILEPPGRGATLAARPVEPRRIAKLSPIASLVLTFGCKFACPYCPIPAYNQRQHRVKSGARIAEEMARLNREYGLRYFFGADDNFFNNKQRTLEIVQTLAEAEFDGKRLSRVARWYTEVTVHDTLLMKDHLKLVRESGCRALWLGVEDLTATLVKKGQSAARTVEAFVALRQHGICPMPMMMHHDSQPLYSWGSNYGLLNQIRILRKAGAVSLQVLMLTPASGSKLLEGTYSSGQVFRSVAGKRVTPHMHDGNYVVASSHPRPWTKQLNMILGYAYFYNPVWFIVNLIRGRTPVSTKPAGMQLVGMAGLVMTIVRTSGWVLRLMTGRIERYARAPGSRLPIRAPDGSPASHAPTGMSPPLVRLRMPTPRVEPRAEVAVAVAG